MRLLLGTLYWHNISMSATRNIANRLRDQSNAAVLNVEIMRRGGAGNSLNVSRADSVWQKLPCVHVCNIHTGWFALSRFYFHLLCISFFFFNYGTIENQTNTLPHRTRPWLSVNSERRLSCIFIRRLTQQSWHCSCLFVRGSPPSTCQV